MSYKKELFNKINEHLLKDLKPSVFLKTLENNEYFNKVYPFTMLSALKKVEQNRKYHPEGDVWTHTLMVVDEASQRRNKSINPKVLMWSALLHDIGKAPATKVRNGRITSYEHEKIGSMMTVEFLICFSNDYNFIYNVAAMVRWHMQALYVIKNMAFSNIHEMLKEVYLDEIALLNLCDRLGRGDMTKEKAEDEKKAIKIFVKKCMQHQKKNLQIISLF